MDEDRAARMLATLHHGDKINKAGMRAERTNKLRGDFFRLGHGSVFRTADGSVVHGPASSRQVSYAARINAGQVELQGPHH